MTVKDYYGCVNLDNPLIDDKNSHMCNEHLLI